MRTTVATILISFMTMLMTAAIAVPEQAKGKSAHDEGKGKGKGQAKAKMVRPVRLHGLLIAASLADQTLTVMSSIDMGDGDHGGPATPNPVPTPVPVPTPDQPTLPDQPAPAPEPVPTPDQPAPEPAPVPVPAPDSDPANPSDPTPPPTAAQAQSPAPKLALTGQFTVLVTKDTVLRRPNGGRVSLVEIVRALTTADDVVPAAALPVEVTCVEDRAKVFLGRKATAREVIVRDGLPPEPRPLRR